MRATKYSTEAWLGHGWGMAGLGHSNKTEIPGAWFMWERTGHDCLGLGRAWGTLGCETEKSKEIGVGAGFMQGCFCIE